MGIAAFGKVGPIISGAIVGSFALCAGPADVRASQPLQTMNVQKFDVDGVRLYMSGADAIKALKARFGKSAPLHIYYTTTNVKPEMRRIDQIGYSDGNYLVKIVFDDNTPPTKSAPEQVESISVSLDANVELAGNQSDQYADIFYRDIQTKYGSPTGSSLMGTYLWCTTIVRSENVSSYPCAPYAPFMSWDKSNLRLELIDSDLRKRVRQYGYDNAPSAEAHPSL